MVFVLFLLGLIYLIRETLFIFAAALLFAYLLWPLVNYLDERLPGVSRVPALTIVYLSLVAVLIAIGIQVLHIVDRGPNILVLKSSSIRDQTCHFCGTSARAELAYHFFA